MLRAPRRLPNRYNRRVNPLTRRFVKQRHVRRRQYSRERWQRAFARFRRKTAAVKGFVMRFLALFTAGFVLLAVGILLFSPIFSVREIRVRRSDPRIDIDRVQRVLWPLVGRHLFFLSSQEVMPMLQEGLPADKDRAAIPGIPDLVGVEVTKQYPSGISLRLTLDPLLARLQIINPDDPTGKNAATGSTLSDYLTSQGIYVQYRNDQAGSGQLLPAIRIVDWAVRPQAWMPLLDGTFLKTMQNAEQALGEQFGQKVTERTVFIRAREFHLRTAEYSLWFDLRSPLENQLLRYRVFLQTVGKAAAKEYIDLRLADRVVYK